MSKSDRSESQNFKITKDDMKFVKAFLKDRDKEEFPYVGDYFIHVLKKYVEFDTGLTYDMTERIEEMKVICPDGELQYIEECYVCNRGGNYSQGNRDRRKKPSTLKVGKIPMSEYEVKNYCRSCWSNEIVRIGNKNRRKAIAKGIETLGPCLPDKDGSMYHQG